MKVKELVELLLKEDQELEVRVEAPRDGTVVIDAVLEIQSRVGRWGKSVYDKYVCINTYFD